MSVVMHTHGVKPDKERLIALVYLVNKLQGSCKELFIYGFHSLSSQGSAVFHAAVSKTVNHTPWPKAFSECGILWIVRVFRAFLGIQVIKITKELVKAVIGRQEFILVAR